MQGHYIDQIEAARVHVDELGRKRGFVGQIMSDRLGVRLSVAAPGRREEDVLTWEELDAAPRDILIGMIDELAAVVATQP